jgi:hypothetical protein
MKFKPESKTRLEKEWKDSQLTKMVKDIVEDVAKYAKKKWKWEFLITSIFRTPAEDAALHASGIHSAWRAVDVRTLDQKEEAVNDVANYTNTKWKYDPQRPVMKVCFKEPHGNGVHAHFQVHPRTIEIKSTPTPKPPDPKKPTPPVIPTSFKGSAEPFDEKGLKEITGLIGIKAAELWAVLTVEARGWGFQPNRRPVILFERHIFSRRTNRVFDAQHPDISNPQAGGYGSGGDFQYERLESAIALNRVAALESASWGIGQVMGFNAEISGYRGVEDMVRKMIISETEQLRAMAAFILNNGLQKALQKRDWAAFASVYNGKNFAINKYDTRLAAAYGRFANGGAPDLKVRAAQIYLTYLGYNPGTVDGFPGKFTFAALNEFQAQNKLKVENEVGDKVLKALKKKVATLK